MNFASFSFNDISGGFINLAITSETCSFYKRIVL
nr:MAG TPA: hypothetical protein [Caudoviricetes sp.]